MPTSSLTAEQLKGILDVADDAIICIDATQKIIFFNQGAERIFGWSAEEIRGQEINVLLPDRYRKDHPSRIENFKKSKTAAKRMAERQVIYAIRKDGSEFPAEASISKLQGKTEWIYAAILRDVSSRQAYERELEAAKEKAEAAVQAKSMFLANMSHEIRTPLNAVIGMTSLMLSTQINEEQRDYTETIRASSEALLAIINDLLDYSKIEIGKLEIEHHPFDLRRCVEEAMDLLASTASEKGIDLAYMIEEGVPATILADAARLRQILVNLLSNAIKFTHYGEVVVLISAQQRTSGAYEIRFSVKDTGIGIPQDRLQDIFESFTQVDASTTRKYGGTGLGLAISKRLTEIMGGAMSVESEVGKGSTFTFTLIAEASGEQLAQNLLQEHSVAFAGKRILIVDDNSTNRRILVKQALLWGMVPSAAASAAEALDLVRHGHAFDVGILDMSMPEMDGLQLAAEIRKYRDAKSLPLVMLTSVVHRTRTTEQPDIQFAAYLNKPIKPAALFEVLMHTLGGGTPVPAATPLADTAKTAETISLHILVAEDNTINQKVVKQLLLHLGYRADVVGNGVEALDAVERQAYDVVLMDVQMPELDGLEATRRIRKRFTGKSAPYIIAMTAIAMPGDREACFAAGVDAYVPKPVELDDLRESLAIAAAARSASGSKEEAEVVDQSRIEQLLAIQDANNPNLLADIIHSFVHDSPNQLQTIADAVEAQDGQLLAATAHYLLSGIEFLGMKRMREPCKKLEQMGKHQDFSDARREVENLMHEFDLASKRILELQSGSRQ
ncbi:MAG: response regulator [Burkholderiales bacterium]|nr:response regulator [Burkholderiales bacterium]